MLEGSASSLQIVSVFIKRTVAYGMKENYTADVNFLHAIEQAKLKDNEREAARAAGTLDQLPLLHGLPFSAKDQFFIKGTASTLGLLKRALSVDDVNSPLVELLYREGAFNFTKSHCSQFTIPHTESPLYGLGMHPIKKHLTIGGSTGGEAGLLSTGCTPFGIGTNLGGSVNVPAAWTGIAAMSVTHKRIPPLPFLGPNFGFNFARMLVNTTVGVMAKYSDDISLVMEAICHKGSFRRYSEMTPIPFKREEAESTKKRRYGLWNPEFIKQTPVSRKLVKKAREIMEKAGHEIVEIPPDEQLKDDIIELVTRVISPAQKLNSLQASMHEPLVALNNGYTYMPYMSRW